MIEFINEIIKDPKYIDLFKLLKGFRNGLVYGVKIRFPHALVMTCIFYRGSWRAKVRAILLATYIHAKNLSLFVLIYKLTMLLQFKINQNKEHHSHSFVSGCIGGYLIFGKLNTINRQIVLYLFGRVVFGLIRLAVKNNWLPESKHAFPIFAGINWGLGMWEFTEYPEVVLPSVKSSLKYIYVNSDYWADIYEYMFI